VLCVGPAIPRASAVVVRPGSAGIPHPARAANSLGLRRATKEAPALVLDRGSYETGFTSRDCVRGLGRLARQRALSKRRSRNVIVIYDERTALPSLAAIDASIVSTLSEESSEPVQVYSEGMDLSRFGSETHMANLREYLRAKYADRKIDVAIAVLGPSLDFLLTYGQTILGADVVFCAVDERELRSRSLPSNVTGVVLTRQFAVEAVTQ
jgi:hypothetical protein